MSLDGKIATRTGDSKWISSEASRRRVHHLRGHVDAVIVGSGTVRADDPLLTARPPGPRVASRVVLSSDGTLPEGCRLLQTLDAAPVIVATLAGRGAELRQRGCDVVELPEQDGRPSVTALAHELGRRRMTNVLVEGGAGVLGSFHDADLIDELHVYVAPRLIGGAGATSPIGGLGLGQVGQSRRPIVRWKETVSGTDRYINAHFLFGDPPARPSADQPA
jgi:diaminohydroxyphosphoribosylaminopyrimidine deaminase/5-amino-6-(5-phosphoribosylamino)uracil reductase